MAKKVVRIPYLAWCNVEIDTDETDEDAIINEAMEYAGFSGYAGNGAMSGKLVGTSASNVTVEVNDDYYDSADVPISVGDE